MLGRYGPHCKDGLLEADIKFVVARSALLKLSKIARRRVRMLPSRKVGVGILMKWSSSLSVEARNCVDAVSLGH